MTSDGMIYISSREKVFVLQVDRQDKLLIENPITVVQISIGAIHK